MLSLSLVAAAAWTCHAHAYGHPPNKAPKCGSQDVCHFHLVFPAFSPFSDEVTKGAMFEIENTNLNGVVDVQPVSYDGDPARLLNELEYLLVKETNGVAVSGSGISALPDDLLKKYAEAKRPVVLLGQDKPDSPRTAFIGSAAPAGAQPDAFTMGRKAIELLARYYLDEIDDFKELNDRKQLFVPPLPPPMQ
jgi:ABC-type sugar transport system substrate-binding protein